MDDGKAASSAPITAVGIAAEPVAASALAAAADGASRPPRLASSGMVLQIGDQHAWSQAGHALVATVRSLAAQLNFTYHEERFDGEKLLRPPFARLVSYPHSAKRLSALRAAGPDACPFTHKVAAIRRAHATLPPDAVLLYVDLDAEYTAPGCDAAELARRLPTTATLDGSPCLFIAQDTPFIAHTGVLALRGGRATAALLEAWEREQRRLLVCEGSADQIALANALLEHWSGRWKGRSADSSHEQQRCDKLITAYHATGNYDLLHQYNTCFRDRLLQGGMAAQVNRSADGVCLLPLTTRMAMHDYFDYWASNDLFFHHKWKGNGKVGKLVDKETTRSSTRCGSSAPSKWVPMRVARQCHRHRHRHRRRRRCRCSNHFRC